MKGKPNPIIGHIKVDLKAGLLKPKQIAEKYNCSISTVYDASYRMRKQERLDRKAARERAKLEALQNAKAKKTSVPPPKLLSYRDHLEIELNSIRKEIATLEGAAAFLTFRITQLDATGK